MPDRLPSWSDTPTKTAVVEFVAAVTDPGSDEVVPEVDRVAVFDNDGTSSTENPGIPPHQIIGSRSTVTFQIGDTRPELIKGTDLAVIDDGPQKPITIHQAVGQRPIFADGNTDGDLPMLQWTAGNSGRTLKLAVHHTGAERESTYDVDPVLGSGTEKVIAAAAGGAWTVVDVAKDWATVYAPD